MATSDIPRVSDTERLGLIRKRHPAASVVKFGCDCCFLICLLDSRDADIIEKDAEIERLCLAIGGLRMEIEDQATRISTGDAEIARLKGALRTVLARVEGTVAGGWLGYEGAYSGTLAYFLREALGELEAE